LGRFDEASAVAVREVEMARAWGDPVNLGRALHALGVARGNEGIADLEAAVATLDGVYDVGLAGCLLDLGSALRRTGRRADSRPLLERALEISERIGAHSYAETARTELAAAGARPRRVVRTGVEALTPSELRVGKLAATGRSNPEIAQELFVTRKTVEKHLGNVFMKLDISSREQLPDHLGADAG
jgi:DNA-binding CsgD family transcriptional regulator